MDRVQLSSTQRSLFAEKGYLCLPEAFSPAQLRPVQKRITEDLSRHGITASGREFPKAIRTLPVFQQIGKLSQWVNIPDLEARFSPPYIEDVVRTLSARRVKSRQSQLLLSPPKQGEWRLDGLNWHTDVAGDKGEIPGIQVFIVIHDLQAHGGATLILSGSHLHAKNPETKVRIREALRNGREGDATLHEPNLSLVELIGTSGDVYVMDMRVLHTPSINTSSQMRAVATVRYFFE